MRSMASVISLALAATLLLSLSLTAAAQTTLNGAGATFPEPLYKQWFHDLNQKTGIRVNYQGIGSGGGMRALQGGTVDFAGSDAVVADKDLGAYPGRLLQIPTVGGAVALGYNIPGVTGRLRLSPRTLAGIYLGIITNWNDSRLAAENPGTKLPNRPITVVHRSDSSGTTFLFTSYLAQVSDTWKSRVGAGTSINWPTGQGGKGNPGVAGLVRQIPGAIGYMELAYATQNKIPVASVRNRSGRFISPTLASSTACIKGAVSRLEKDPRNLVVNAPGADAYPIVGLTFIFAIEKQSNAAKKDALVKMLNYMLAYGQRSAPSLQYVPLPPEVLRVSRSLVGRIN